MNALDNPNYFDAVLIWMAHLLNGKAPIFHEAARVLYGIYRFRREEVICLDNRVGSYTTSIVDIRRLGLELACYLLNPSYS